jgi:hypothetical protein
MKSFWVPRAWRRSRLGLSSETVQAALATMDHADIPGVVTAFHLCVERVAAL